MIRQFSKLNSVAGNICRSRQQSDHCNRVILRYSSSAKIEYKLTYFNLRAMAEPIRWMFVIAKVPFEDDRISFEDWPKRKSSTGWGKIPVLYINGQELTQSGTIGRYVANTFGFVPQDPMDKARCDEIVDAITELIDLYWRPFIRETDKDKRKMYRTELLKPLEHTLGKINTKIASTSHGLVAGDKITWADLVLANYVQIGEETVDRDIPQKYPSLKVHKDRIFAIPEVKAWVERRPKTIC